MGDEPLRKDGEAVTQAEKRMRLAYCSHRVESSLTPGYYHCFCGCGYVGVCRHCVPTAEARLPWLLCEEAKQLVQSGQACCTQEGRVYVVTDTD